MPGNAEPFAFIVQVRFRADPIVWGKFASLLQWDGQLSFVIRGLL